MNFNDYMATLLVTQLSVILKLQGAVNSGESKHQELQQAAATMKELAQTISVLNDCKATAIDSDCLNMLITRIQLQHQV